jgi:hypothetical protein
MMRRALLLALLATVSPALAQEGPQVPAAAPGVFTVSAAGPNRLHLVVTGHVFTTRETIEKYMAYQAAEQTLARHAGWFTLTQHRAKGDSAAKRDPDALHYSFRMTSWRPAWRIRTAAGWKNWSPGAPFTVDDATVTGYQASADIMLHKGMMDSADPLAFDASALSDFLVNQVAPPQ